MDTIKTDMEATDKEQKLLTRIFHSNIIIGVLIVMFGFMVFAKTELPEYRPIVISYRSVSINTPYQPSTTRYTNVSIPVQISCAASLVSGQSGSIALQVCSTSGGTYTTIAQLTNSNTVSIAIALTVTNTNGGVLNGIVPAGFYYKVITTTTTGTPTYSILNNAQETNI